jgi:hypothetical protein
MGSCCGLLLGSLSLTLTNSVPLKPGSSGADSTCTVQLYRGPKVKSLVETMKSRRELPF